MHQIKFRHLTLYDPGKPSITVPIRLSFVGQSVDFEAKIDTGSTHCFFERKHGEQLGLDIESGAKQRVDTATGTFTSYGHTVDVSVLGLKYEATVYFAADEGFARNVLGRFGWLDRIRLGIVDYDGELYVGPYNDSDGE